MTDWLQHARPFDLIFTWPKFENHDLATFFISGAISIFTGGGPSHVTLLFSPITYWEVTYPKPRFAPVTNITTTDYDIEIGCHKAFATCHIPEHIQHAMTDKMIEIVASGKSYDVEELFWHLLDELGIGENDGSDPTKYVCSSGVETVYRSVGYGFCQQERLVSPQDLRMSADYHTRWQSWKT